MAETTKTLDALKQNHEALAAKIKDSEALIKNNPTVALHKRMDRLTAEVRASNIAKYSDLWVVVPEGEDVPIHVRADDYVEEYLGRGHKVAPVRFKDVLNTASDVVPV